MAQKLPFKLFLSIFLSLALGVGIGMNLSHHHEVSIRMLADYLRAVLQADRAFYTHHVVERMEAMLLVTASENWREERTLPLPAQFFKEASRNLEVRGNPFRYRLVSLWPLNPENAPHNDKERQALEQVIYSNEVVEQEIERGGKSFYQIIYPDKAISRTCVDCHNTHEKSPKQNFKMNDIMGGLEILIPL